MSVAVSQKLPAIAANSWEYSDATSPIQDSPEKFQFSDENLELLGSSPEILMQNFLSHSNKSLDI
jgi:hypothetical protein